MKGSISVSSIKFLNGSSLELKEDSIVLFVGANNSGKSLILRELFNSIYQAGGAVPGNFIIKGVTTNANGTEDELLDNLESNLTNNGQFQYPNGPAQGTSVSRDQLLNAWRNFSVPLTPASGRIQIENFFVKKLETQNRLQLVEPSPNLGYGNRSANHPIHLLKNNTSLELQFSKLFKKAFYQEIIVNHNAGVIIPLHVGKRPELSPVHDRVSAEYSAELNKLGQLQIQGDGMKSFAGIFLSLFAENFSINIIDEPEAFLHPPQAKLLGEMLSKNLDVSKQLFIATHSEHFLKGLLSHSGERLIVVRLERTEDITKTTSLVNKDIKQIWKDPILKHSNVLDGLFHPKVVLSESESDSRFFSAIASALVEGNDIDSPDVHYIQSGGKHKFPIIVRALKKLDVPLKVIGDFDILNAEQPLKDVFTGLGGDWSEIEKDFKIVKEDIDAQRPELSAEDLKKNIEEILNKLTEPVVGIATIKELEKTIKKASAWGVAKKVGKDLVRAGGATLSYNKLDAALKKVGLIVLEIGEIEAFDKTIGNHGPKWVNEVLEKDLLNSPDLAKARAFITTNIVT